MNTESPFPITAAQARARAADARCGLCQQPLAFFEAKDSAKWYYVAACPKAYDKLAALRRIVTGRAPDNGHTQRWLGEIFGTWPND